MFLTSSHHPQYPTLCFNLMFPKKRISSLCVSSKREDVVILCFVEKDYQAKFEHLLRWKFVHLFRWSGFWRSCLACRPTSIPMSTFSLVAMSASLVSASLVSTSTVTCLVSKPASTSWSTSAVDTPPRIVRSQLVWLPNQGIINPSIRVEGMYNLVHLVAKLRSFQCVSTVW